MKGTIVVLILMGAILLTMCITYKRYTNSNLLKDLWNDIRNLMR